MTSNSSLLDQGTVPFAAVPREVSRLGCFHRTPLVIEVQGKKQIISTGSDAVMAYDPKDGHEVWKVMYPGGYSVVPSEAA